MASVRQTFQDRLNYDKLNKNFSFPQDDSLYTKYYIDTWNVIPFYGKVDTFGIPIIPKQEVLRFCSYGTDNLQIKVLQPVAEYFFSLRQQYENFCKLGNISKKSNFFKTTLPPINGFIDSNIEYYDKIKNNFVSFIDYLNQNNILNSIKTYDDFINELLIYIETNDLYMTRAGYVESKDFSLLHTGLAIEIYNGKTSDEQERSKFFNDINHFSYLELSTRNNFKIDREIPWRIFLDIRTLTPDPDPDPKILSFSNKNDVFPRIEDSGYIPDFEDKIQKFFDVYYNRVIPYDENSYPYFEEFVLILQTYYKDFINGFPYYKKYSVDECGNAKVIDVLRQNIQENYIAYDRKKYVNLYIKFRNKELLKVADKNLLNNSLDRALQIYEINQNMNSSIQESILAAIKYYTDNVGTLAYRSLSLYEIDKKKKMP